MTRARFFTTLSFAVLLTSSLAGSGCNVITGEIPCEASHQCPDTIRKCDLEGIDLDAGELGLCVPGTARTGIPEPDEALIDVPDGGVVDAGPGGGFPFWN